MDDALRARFERKYAQWKERLLDLTGRNRLLNFRTTKVSTIELTSPDSDRLFERLVLAEKPLKFPLYRGTSVLSLTDEESGDETEEIEYRVDPGDLESSKAPPDLERSLYRLNQLSRSSKEERGVNTLYVALGMLHWKPQDDADTQKAPLLMVPVNLHREDHLQPYVLSPFDEEAELNPSLIFMLKNDFDFALPEFPEDPDEHALGALIEELRKAVTKMGWSVTEEAWLGQFQFKKLAMYKDLEEHDEPAIDNARVTGVAGCAHFTAAEGVAESEAFDEIKPSEIFTVLDADKSQLEAIIRARQGEDLIIQGPPGTGKSQTIANLIAQSLADGKKVLFVSEKMAALSVVYRRLEEVGLAPFCLELHSDKANKRDTLSRIGQAARVGRTMTEPPSQVEQQFRSLLTLRRELNDYARALHSATIFEKTPFQIHGALARRVGVPDVAASINIPIEELNSEKEIALLRQARRLSQMPEMLVNYHNHPWFGCNVDTWSMEVQTDLGAHLQRFKEALTEIDQLLLDLASTIDAEKPDSIDALGRFAELVRLISVSPAPPRDWLALAPLQDLADVASKMSADRARHADLKEQLGNHYALSQLNDHFVELDESLNGIDQPILDSLLGERTGSTVLAEISTALGQTLRSMEAHLEDARVVASGAEQLRLLRRT